MSDERQHDVELDARRLDWALREVVGGEHAPDVTATVLARAAAGELGEDAALDAAAPRPLSRARWLAFAALFLLGALTVLGVALAKRDARGSAGAKDEAQQGETDGILEVTRAEDIAVLPRDLKAVELRNLDDAAVAALVARCPDLEHLRVFASTAYKRAGDAPAQSITDAALPVVARLTKLRQLDLLGTVLVKGPGLKELTALPRLESLALESFDVADDDLAFLPRLSSLRDLSLTHNDMLGNGAWESIGKCVGLRQLSVTGGRGVDSASLAPLGNLVHLEVLALFGIGSWSRGVADEAVAKRFGLRMDFRARPPGTGITVGMLAGWPKLRELELMGAPDLEPAIGAFLRDHCPRLRWLRLDDCPQIENGTIADVLSLPALTTLMLSGCRSVTPEVVPMLVAAKQLGSVDFGNIPWVTLAHVEQLMAAGRDVHFLHQRDEAFQRAVAELRQRFQHGFTRQNLGLVRTLAEIEALQWNTQSIDVRELGDRAAARLAQFPYLRQVSFVRDDDEAFTAQGLRAVAALPRLEHLELNNLLHLEVDALTELRLCKTLRLLDIVNCGVSDAGLQVLPELPALTTLKLRGVRSFGEDGMRAVGKCRSLRAVDLSKCEQLSRDAIAQLGTLLELESLQLAELPRLNDSALMGLQHLTKLRTLDISRGPFTSMGLQALAGMRELRVLKMSGNVELVPSALTSIPVGVEELELDDCKGLDAPAAAVLRDRFPGLRVLGIAGSAWLDDDGLVTILQSAKLERLGIRGCPKLTVRSVEAIRNAKALRDLDATGTPFFTDEVAAELARQRPELHLKYRIW